MRFDRKNWKHWTALIVGLPFIVAVWAIVGLCRLFAVLEDMGIIPNAADFERRIG